MQWSLPPLPPPPAATALPGALAGFEAALAEIEQIKPALVSLDLFDTLIFRRDTTAELQERKTAHFIRWHLIRIGITPPPVEAIRIQRKLATEQLAAEAHDRGEHGEFELRELLVRTVSLSVPQITAVDLQNLGQRATAFEIQEEIACLALIPGAQAFLEALQNHVRIVCTSDTPLPCEVICTVLDNLAIRRYFATVYVSSHAKTNKRTGGLFQCIARENRLPPQHLLHLGDNPINDLASPLARGWQARLIQHTGLQETYHATTQRITWAETLGCSDYLHPSPTPVSTTSSAFRAGIESFGLAFALFALELLKLDQIHDYRKIYFVSRDGYLLNESFAALANNLRLLDGTTTANKTTYVHLSRLSTLCPSGDEDIEQAIHYATLVNAHQSGLGFFATLGLDTQKYHRLLVENGCSNEELNSLNPNTLATIYKAVQQDTSVRRALLDDLKAKRQLLSSYLGQHEFFGPGKVLFVDVGWRYRIAANIAAALQGYDQLPDIHCLLFGHTGELRSPRFTTHPGVFYDAERFDPLEQLLFQHKEIIENICTASHGTCLGYRKKGAQIEAILAEDDAPSPIRQELQAGIIAGVRQFAESFNQYALHDCFHLDALIRLLRPFLDRSDAGHSVIQMLQQPTGALHGRPNDRNDLDSSFLHGESRSYLPDKLPPIHINMGDSSGGRPITEPLEKLLGLVQHIGRSNVPVVLWGWGLLGKLLYPHIKEKLTLVVDMDSSLHGKPYQDHVISTPEAIKPLTHGSFMVLFTPLSRALPSILVNSDIKVVRASDWLHPGNR